MIVPEIVFVYFDWSHIDQIVEFWYALENGVGKFYKTSNY